MQTPLYPLRLRPSLHTKPWGGRRLATMMGKALPTDEPYGEAWEMHDTAVVAEGALAGRTVGDLLAAYGEALVGAGSRLDEGMPLLAKILDATDWLSVQVHPDDAQARQLEGEPRGKTEAWYILAAEPGAKLVIGVQPGTPRERIASAIEQQTLEGLLAYAEVGVGDVLFIRSGTIHALGPGLMIYEIQQSSDLTYRFYDWGRMGLDGKPRALHIDKGLAVANTESLPTIRQTAGDTSPVVELVSCPFFTTWLHQLGGANPPAVDLDTGGGRFHILTCIEGDSAIDWQGMSVPLTQGETALIPASLGAYSLRAAHGAARVLRSAQA